MKTLLSCATLALFCVCSYAQEKSYQMPLPLNDKGRVEFQEIIEVENVSKDELFTRANAWFVSAYNSANDVIQMSDKEQGIIIGKGIAPYEVMFLAKNYPYKLRHTIKVETKENKARLTMTDFYVEETGREDRPVYDLVNDNQLYKKNGNFKPYNRQHKERLIVLWRSTLESLKSTLQKEKADNW